MKKAFLILLLLTGCASGTQDDPNAPKVALHLEQFESAPNAFTYNGPVNVRFALSVTNSTKDKVKLNRIEIRTIGSGAYTIPTTSTMINTEVGPGEAKTMTVALWGYAQGGRLHSMEPVSVRAIGYFTGPTGAFIRLFSEYFTPQ
jgi:hypothetical protein